jgi:hypothetical protein
MKDDEKEVEKGEGETNAPAVFLGWAMFNYAILIYPTLRPTRDSCVRDYLEGTGKATMNEYAPNGHVKCHRVTITDNGLK